MEDRTQGRGLSRRNVLVTAAGVTVGVSGLAACGGAGSGASTYGGTGEAGGKGASPAETAGSPTGGSAGGRELVRLADVPVGGAVSAEDASGHPVIVAQPRKGQVVGFSAVCTHRGCTVAPEGKILACPCHGSTYDLATGKNTGGPAPRPLDRLQVKVVDGAVVET